MVNPVGDEVDVIGRLLVRVYEGYVLTLGRTILSRVILYHCDARFMSEAADQLINSDGQIEADGALCYRLCKPLDALRCLPGSLPAPPQSESPWSIGNN